MKLERDYYQRLSPVFYWEGGGGEFSKAKYFLWNNKLCKEMGMEEEFLQQHPQFFTGVMKECYHPIAQAYSGHQFGYYTRLGDGRALLLGEWKHHGRFYDISVKGSGPTAYSRGGDGLGTLSSMIREYIVSEFMNAVGIPTTRSLAVLTTGKSVYRKGREPGGILARVSKSHLRVGTFQFAYDVTGVKGLSELADYAITRLYPQWETEEEKYLRFYRQVIDHQAKLVAKWMSLGFIHGVMNTDNMSIVGETIDYGPCAFMEMYRPSEVFSSIDRAGRYRFENQPVMAKWNLARLGDCFVSLLKGEQEENVLRLTEELEKFDAIYQREYRQRMNEKLGLYTTEKGDEDLQNQWLSLLYRYEMDYTNAFAALTEGKFHQLGAEFQPWLEKYHSRCAKEAPEARTMMKQCNPRLIPRAKQMEEILQYSVKTGDVSRVQHWMEYLMTPFDYDREFPKKMLEETDREYYRSYRTYCGT